MFKLIFLSIFLSSAYALVPLYKQCDGEGYNGDRDCGKGNYCAYDNKYFSLCRKNGEPENKRPFPGPTPGPAPTPINPSEVLKTKFSHL